MTSGVAAASVTPVGAGPTTRWVAAGAAWAEAVIHVPLVPDHLDEAPWAGVGFIALSIAGFVLAGLLLVRATRVVWLTTAAVGAGALGGYLLSRSVGLPQLHHDIGDWGNPLGALACAAEALMLGCAVVALRST